MCVGPSHLAAFSDASKGAWVRRNRAAKESKQRCPKPVLLVSIASGTKWAVQAAGAKMSAILPAEESKQGCSEPVPLLSIASGTKWTVQAAGAKMPAILAAEESKQGCPEPVTLLSTASGAKWAVQAASLGAPSSLAAAAAAAAAGSVSGALEKPLRRYVWWAWEKPPCGFIKINIDISTDGDKTVAFAGGYARNHEGDTVGPMIYQTLSVPANQTNLCELQGVIVGVVHASLMKWERIVIEVDNLDVVNFFSANAKVPEMYERLYRRIINLSENFKQFDIAWTPGSVNRLAHEAVGSQSSAHKASTFDVLKFQQILREDKNGKPVLVRKKRLRTNLQFPVV